MRKKVRLQYCPILTGILQRGISSQKCGKWLCLVCWSHVSHDASVHWLLIYLANKQFGLLNHQILYMSFSSSPLHHLLLIHPYPMPSESNYSELEFPRSPEDSKEEDDSFYVHECADSSHSSKKCHHRHRSPTPEIFESRMQTEHVSSSKQQIIGITF